MPDPRPTPPPATDVRPTDARPTDARPTETRPAEAAEAESSKPLGLSLTQIAGGALAAVTAAVAASFLGVAGTLIGAALGSVVSSVAAALYSASLTRAARVSKVLVVRPAGSGTGPLEASAQDPAAVPPVIPQEPLVPAAAPWWTRLRWKPVALVAGGLFVAAMAVVSVSELVLGHPLSDSTQTGTTLTNLGDPAGSSIPSTPTPEQSPGTTPSPSDTPAPTSTPSPSPSAPTNPDAPVAPTTSPGTTPSDTGTSSPTPGTGTGTGTGSGTAPGTPAPAPPTTSSDG